VVPRLERLRGQQSTRWTIGTEYDNIHYVPLTRNPIQYEKHII
jgi:hypothetical protein